MFVDAIYDYYNDEIVGWARDEDGSLVKFNEPPPHYCYVDDDNGNIKSMFNTTVSKVEFDSLKEYKNFVNNTTKRLWESDISPLYKFLSDMFFGSPSTKLNVGLFDIEVDFDLNLGIGYPVPENPYGKINSVSLYDSYNEKYIMIVLSSVDIKLEDGEFPVEVIRCVTEKQLLDTFFKKIDHIDILSAWNGTYFDIPYIMERCKMLYGKKGLSKLCRGGYNAREKEVLDSFGNTKVVYDLVGRVHLDYLEIYRKFTFGERDSYKLDNICEFENVGRKVDFVGDLGELYRTDPQTFFEYSLHDSRLLFRLDKKLKFINLAITMGRNASIRYPEVLGSIKYLEFAIRNYAHYVRDEVLVLPDKEDNKREDFPGAFVLDTKVGVYGWSSSIDIASLYPNTIISIGISPETHLLQCEYNTDDFVEIVHQTDKIINLRYMETGEYFQMTAEEVFELIKSNNFTISAYGSIFDNRIGIIPEILSVWYKERKSFKTTGKEYANQINMIDEILKNR